VILTTRNPIPLDSWWALGVMNYAISVTTHTGNWLRKAIGARRPTVRAISCWRPSFSHWLANHRHPDWGRSIRNGRTPCPSDSATLSYLWVSIGLRSPSAWPFFGYTGKPGRPISILACLRYGVAFSSYHRQSVPTDCAVNEPISTSPNTKKAV